jgi:tRNA U38,U39,U40 pseudouridine synthase TruA
VSSRIADAGLRIADCGLRIDCGLDDLEVAKSTIIAQAAITKSAISNESAVRNPQSALLVYTIRGDGFLRHMVRTIVGSLVEIGRGRYPTTWITDVIASRDRARAGPTAPAKGLFLVSVEYAAALADEA